MTAGPIAAIDVGSTAVKAARFDRLGERISAVAEVRHRLPSAEGYLDGNRVLDAVLKSLNMLNLDGVRYVAMSTIWQTDVAISMSEDVPDRIPTWETPHDESVLRRTQERLKHIWNADDSGSWIHQSYPLLMNEMNSSQPPMRHLDLGGWLIEKLLGVQVGWSKAIASGSGAWSNSKQLWSGVAEAQGFAEALRAEGINRHAVRAKYPIYRLPEALKSAEWLPPLPDGLCHNLGSGAVGSKVAITVGTSGSTRLVDAYPFTPRPEGYWEYRCDTNTSACGGAVSSVGNFLEWAEAFSGQRIDWSFANQKSPKLGSTLVKPDVFGRRGPDYPADATGTVLGLRSVHNATDVTQASAVDVWYSFQLLFRNLQRCRIIDDVYVGGGVLERSPIAAQLLADAIGYPVIVSDEIQPALKGAALYAAHYIQSDSAEPSLDSLVDELKVQFQGHTKAEKQFLPRTKWSRVLAERWEHFSN